MWRSTPEPVRSIPISPIWWGFPSRSGPGAAAYVPLQHRGDSDLFGGGMVPGQIGLTDALAVLKPLLEDRSVLKIGQDIKYDWVILKRHGIDMRPFDDTMLISYVLDAGRGPHGMDELAKRHLGHTPMTWGEVAGTGKSKVTFDRVDLDKATAYAAEDADVTLRLWQVLKPRLPAEGRATPYETLERPLIDVIGRMEMRGISVDRQILSRLSGDFAQSIARLEDEIQEIAGEKINLGSPKQIGDILFGKMGLPGAKKTPSGQWATPATLLEELAQAGHILPEKILEWRQLSKLKSTYTDSLQQHMHPETKRVHTSYALASTTTGRLSSSEPESSEHPDPHRGRPQDSPRFRRAAGLENHFGRLQPDRIAAVGAHRRHSAIAGSVRAEASTCTRRPPRRCSGCLSTR